MRRRRTARPTHIFEVIVRHYPKTPGAYQYGVEVPALPGCFSDGRTREEALENAKEAIALYLSELKQHGRVSRDLVEVTV